MVCTSAKAGQTGMTGRLHIKWTGRLKLKSFELKCRCTARLHVMSLDQSKCGGARASTLGEPVVRSQVPAPILWLCAAEHIIKPRIKPILPVLLVVVDFIFQAENAQRWSGLMID